MDVKIGRVGDEAKKRKSPAKSGTVGISASSYLASSRYMSHASKIGTIKLHSGCSCKAKLFFSDIQRALVEELLIIHLSI